MNNLDQYIDTYNPKHPSYIENNLILNWYPKRIKNLIKNTDSILELGLGHGYTSVIFNEIFTHHTIIEGSEKIIEQFKQKYINLNIDIKHQWFETFETNKKFDVIIMGFILEHVNNPKEILEKYKQFLSPNGQLFIAVPNAKSLNRRYGLEMGLINNIYDLNKNDIALGHLRQYSLETLNKEVIESGYKIVHTEGIYLKPLPLSVLQTLENFEENLNAMLEVGIEFPDISVAILLEVSL